MAAPNLTELVTSTLRKRSQKVADAIRDNNALLTILGRRGKIMPFSDGRDMVHPIIWQENDTFKRYSGAELLNINQSEVLSAATYGLKQAAIAVVITGLEQLQNRGRSRVLDLLRQRMDAAMTSMKNNICEDIYSDGTADAGKQITGLQALVSTSPSTGTVGGINRGNYTFWRNQYDSTAPSKANAEQLLRKMWLKLKRGKDMPDLILAGDTSYEHYWASLTDRQRFGSNTGALAKAGWPSLGFLTAEVVCDGGQGGNAPANSFYMLNCDYLFWRPHSDRNMVPLPQSRPINQDAKVTLLAWCGNMAMNNAKMQGRIGSA